MIHRGAATGTVLRGKVQQFRGTAQRENRVARETPREVNGRWQKSLPFRQVMALIFQVLMKMSECYIVYLLSYPVSICSAR